jgi:hypothetical protein
MLTVKHLALSCSCLQPGGSSGGIQLKWADPDLQHKKKKALDESNADNRMVSNCPQPCSRDGKGGSLQQKG